MAKKSKKRSIEPVKTRKDLRKEKRQQKKANRAFFQKRKKELKLAFRANLKQNQKNASTKNKSTVSRKYTEEQACVTPEDQEENFSVNNCDEEIDSDFELSDEEMEMKTKSISKECNKPAQQPVTQIEKDRERLRKQEQALKKDMGKQRIRQLKAANEDEDKTIRKLEKLLKIDKTKGRKKVPKMFNDGLDYALEMCLPENMEKMYAAAKEATSTMDGSDNEWQEDFELATGKSSQKPANENPPKSAKKKIDNKSCVNDGVTKKSELKKMAKLRQVESKYFIVSDLESDLSEVDSEFEDTERKKGNKTKTSKKDDSPDDDFDGVEDDDENENEDFDDDDDADDDDDEGPEEVSTKTKSSFKRKLEKEKRLHHATEVGSKRKKEVNFELDQSDSDSNDEENEFDEFNDLDEITDEISTNSTSNKKVIEKVIDGNNEIDEESDLNESDVGDSENDVDDEKPEAWEDIYGRKRDKHGNILTEQNSNKYIPPHLRNKSESTDGNLSELNAKQLENLQRLKRLLKGYMNRLSEANMHKIATDIDNLFMKNSRNDMNNTLSSLVCDALIAPVLSPERMVMEHTMLIAVLHANIGSEVGAHFLQTLNDKFIQMINIGIENYAVEDKTLDNVLLILCHMYTFKIFSHNLVYEILDKLTVKLCEKSVECLLLALRSVGFVLRKDDPLALKELILTLQKKCGDASNEMKNNSRLKFMMDVLLAIKNNNMNKIPQYDPTLGEHLRKILKTLLVNGKYVTTLNITMDDLLNANKRGKWWVVGSAWSGNVNDIGGAKKSSTKTNKAQEQQFSEQLLELARKQRMNTDERRHIFCILMSAEDYIDAFEKLLHLAIKDHRVIISVIIHCCLSEKIFNPYYGVLTKRFCEFNRKYQLAVQFSIWDRIKDIASQTANQSKNLAQYVSYLISHGAIPISVLKIVEFAAIDKLTMRVVRQILLSILLGDEDACKQVFQRIAPSDKLKTFKDSIRLFMQHFLAKGISKDSADSQQRDLLKHRLKLVDTLMTTSIFQD